MRKCTHKTILRGLQQPLHCIAASAGVTATVKSTDNLPNKNNINLDLVLYKMREKIQILFIFLKNVVNNFRGTET